ncbi:MAG: enoyl-CoA hydratase/isomerase family protein [Microthrixaceae bacterium]|nr:enoyl-CoA hydratase/isomerase family protein [Acidimicrobiales bacterium]MCB9403691.1 enoyl-CoA hydratase/isomerase family protein [Microthrixaceae bacterium]
MIELTRDGDVFVLRMDNGENRFSPEMVDALQDALATVATTTGPRALVTAGSGKFFTNGLDLDWLGANQDRLVWYLNHVCSLYATVLSLPCPTAAAVNGHAFGAGAMLTLAHDHSVMRSDRGFWCLPEVSLSMPFPPPMQELVVARLPGRTAHQAMITSHRYGAAEAVASGIVDATADEDSVIAAAVERVAPLTGHAGPNLAGVRTHLYATVMAALTPSD